MEDTKEEVKKEKVKIKMIFSEAMKLGIGFWSGTIPLGIDPYIGSVTSSG